MKKLLNKKTKKSHHTFSVIVVICVGIVIHIKSLFIQVHEAGGWADCVLLINLLFLGCVIYALVGLAVLFSPFIYAIATKNKKIILMYIVIIMIALIAVILTSIAIFNQTFPFALVEKIVLFPFAVLHFIMNICRSIVP